MFNCCTQSLRYAGDHIVVVFAIGHIHPRLPSNVVCGSGILAGDHQRKLGGSVLQLPEFVESAPLSPHHHVPQQTGWQVLPRAGAEEVVAVIGCVAFAVDTVACILDFDIGQGSLTGVLF